MKGDVQGGKKLDQFKTGDQDTLHKQYEHIRSIIVEACDIAIDQGKLTAEAKAKYCKSVFEMEVIKGLFEEEKMADHCLAYIREIKDIPRQIMNDIACKYTDVHTSKGNLKANDEARRLLDEMRTNIINKCEASNVRQYNIKMKDYFNSEPTRDAGEDGGSGSETQASLTYIEQFCEDFLCDMKALIEKDKEQWEANMKVKHSECFSEVLHHAIKCKEINSDFIGREDLLNTIKLRMMNEERTRPIIVTGPPGSGI